MCVTASQSVPESSRTSLAQFRDGGVQLKWRTTPAQLWLVFHPLGGYGYLFEDRTQPGAFEESDDIPLQEALSLIGKALLPRVRAAGGV